MVIRRTRQVEPRAVDETAAASIDDDCVQLEQDVAEAQCNPVRSPMCKEVRDRVAADKAKAKAATKDRKPKVTQEDAEQFLNDAVSRSKLFNLLNATGKIKALKSGQISVTAIDLDVWRAIFDHDTSTNVQKVSKVTVLIDGEEVLNKTL